MKARKILVSLAALALVAAISIGGTLAYLTSKDTVTNTFTVGKVAITLDEAYVNEDGDKYYVNGRDADGKPNSYTTDDKDAQGNPYDLADRVKSNAYKLMPGHEYTKDPKVHVAADSENSWLFVKVENGLEKFESSNTGYDKIAKQITDNGWTALPGVTGVYYKEYTTRNTVADVPVFENFQIADGAQDTEGWAKAKDAKITITAYAVQADGFATADAAWSATFGK